MKRSRCLLMLFAIFCGYLSVANAQSLADYQRASASKGCDSIPYPDLNKACRDKQDEVDDYCNETGCGELDGSKLLSRIEDNKNAISNLERVRSDLTSKRDASNDDSERRALEDERSRIEKVIEEKKRESEGLSSQVEDFKYRARGFVEKGQRCREYRIDVAEIFGEALKRARAENDPTIQAAVAGSIREFEESDRGHTIQIKNTQLAIDKCERAARAEPLN